MLDLIAHGAPGHGPVLLLISASEIGFSWNGVSKDGCWYLSLPSGCFLALFSIFRALFF